jgi:hypothetical protein
MTANRVALALEGQLCRKAGHLYGDILSYIAETPVLEPELAGAFTRVLGVLDRQRSHIRKVVP